MLRTDAAQAVEEIVKELAIEVDLFRFEGGPLLGGPPRALLGIEATHVRMERRLDLLLGSEDGRPVVKHGLKVGACPPELGYGVKGGHIELLR